MATEHMIEASRRNTGIPTKGADNSTEQLELYRLLVESVQDYAIFLLDTDGHVASWNPGAKRFKGYEKEEIIGRHFSVFYGPEDIASRKPQRELAEARQIGRVEDEGWRVRKDGTRFWANVIITALYDEHGTLRGYAKVTRDLTGRKAMEDELADANRRLRRREETLALLNEAKDEFISLASHQLRTPATGVKQYLNLILQGFMGDVPKHLLPALQKANDSNERQIELINDLLRVAQVDAGKMVITLKNTDVTKLMQDVVAEQSEAIKRRAQTLTLESSPKRIVAPVDRHRLRTVLENLIDNASKYTPRGGKINVSLTLKKGELQVAIKDTGVGIDAEDVPRLFAKFTRIKNNLSDHVGGSGLGLYWAQRVVALHGGYIDVRSAPGKGSTFTVVIPAPK